MIIIDFQFNTPFLIYSISIFVHTFHSTHIKGHFKIICFTDVTMVTFDPIFTQTFAVILVTICAIRTKLITITTCKGKLGKIIHNFQISSCKYKAIVICDENWLKLMHWITEYIYIIFCVKNFSYVFIVHCKSFSTFDQYDWETCNIMTTQIIKMRMYTRIKKKRALDRTGTSRRVVRASLRVQAPVARLTFVTLQTTHTGETVTGLVFWVTGHLPGASPVAATVHYQQNIAK